MLKYIIKKMHKFNIQSPFKLIKAQQDAVEKLCIGVEKKLQHQVLLGATGSGKTFIMASIINKLNKPALIISHNKTLAAQLYQEFKSFFPDNAISYFVSYYDYYQPEAYMPATDTYIEKETEINENIDKLRLLATTNLLTRRDTLIVASVSCIYNLGSPKEYGNFTLEISKNTSISREDIISRLIELQYQRSEYHFDRATFRIRGEIIDIYPAYLEIAYRINIPTSKILSIESLDPISGKKLAELDNIIIYPAKHYMTDTKQSDIFDKIRNDLKLRCQQLDKEGKKLESYRLNQKVNYDLEMIEELGYVNGIENYSRYFDGRKSGQPPYTLLDYYKFPYKDDWLLFVDESHITIPQIRGMYNGDRSRKKTLIDFGFRLPSAFDNRPLTFLEFLQRIPQTIYVSATPNDWEISKSKEFTATKFKKSYDGITQQLIRPTGIIDPKIIIKPSKNQIIDVVKEILICKKNKERVLITTLTKKTAEDLADFMNEKKYLKYENFSNLSINEYPLVQYLHSDVETLERSDILDDLRAGKYDVLIGINLLREGLDLPEVSLVVILDADKEGFLRSTTSLIQTMGRAARHVHGKVIMYADKITRSMKNAINEVERRRNIQLKYNKKYKLIPQNIIKPIREKLVEKTDKKNNLINILENKIDDYQKLLNININQLTPQDKNKLIIRLQKEMKNAASDLNFELATVLRDKILVLKQLI